MTYESVVASLSPKLFYKLDESSGTTAVDSGSLGINGTYSGTPTRSQASLYAGGTASTRHASGNSAYVSISGLTAMQSWSALTFCAWWKATDQTTDPYIVMPAWAGGSSIPLGLGMGGTNGADNTKLNAGSFSGSSWQTTQVGTTSIAANGIYFVAATLSSMSSGTLTLYVNGAQEAQGGGYTIGSWTQSTLYIGHQWDSGGVGTGTYQGVGVWDSVLTPTQISTLYAGGVTPKIPSIAAVRRSVAVQQRSRRY